MRASYINASATKCGTSRHSVSTSTFANPNTVTPRSKSRFFAGYFQLPQHRSAPHIAKIAVPASFFTACNYLTYHEWRRILTKLQSQMLCPLRRLRHLRGTSSAPLSRGWKLFSSAMEGSDVETHRTCSSFSLRADSESGVSASERLRQT